MPARVIQVEERLPLLQTIPLSLQHLFAMFGATVLVPFLFHVNPATSLLLNGVGTLIYLVICKGRIPAYLGSSFAFIAPVLAVVSIPGLGGYAAAQGGFILFGVFFILGVIAAAGIRMLIERKVDYTQPRNLILTSVVLTAGVSGAVVKIGTLELRGMALGTVVAIVLSLIFGLIDRLRPSSS